MNKYSLFTRIFLIMSGMCLLFFIPFRQSSEGGFLLGAFFIFLAIAMRGISAVRGFSYTFIIFASVSISMYFPDYFKNIGDFNLQKFIVPLLQIIMFGMGSQMSLKDFEGVVKMPQGVFVGIVCQFSIMPLIAMAVLFIFKFPPEIAAGVILVGSSPSGLASNVMSFLARANLALSVTLTAVSTLLAPLMTPLLMKFLAQEYVEIQFWQMMLSIVKMVIIPIALGLLVNRMTRGRAAWINQLMPLVSMAGIAIIITIITAAGRDNLLQMGYLLIIVCLLHNLTGYTLGYWICRLLGMDKKTCRTISLEVGMQNAGLASGIAMEMGKVATVGLAPAVFGPMMNITGSSLATWWRSKKVKDTHVDEIDSYRLFKKPHNMVTVHDYYREIDSDQNQKKISLTVLAEKMDCMPWQVKDGYKSQLSENNFTQTELIEMAQQWKLKKAEEGKFFGINPENTSAAHLERWTNEYLNENY